MDKIVCENIYGAPEFGVVYTITNRINNKIYIGATIKGFNKRYNGNWVKYTHSELLREEVEIYGRDNFQIIDEFYIATSNDDLMEKERYYIELYDSMNPSKGYNMRSSGDCEYFSKELKEKMSKIRKNNGDWVGDKNPKYKNGSSIEGELNPFYGKTHSEETKIKIGLASIGRQAFKGKSHTEESKRKLSESHKKPVYCITTNTKFDSLAEASIFYNTNSSSIIKTCKRDQTFSGRLDDGTKLIWMYYEDYYKAWEDK